MGSLLSVSAPTSGVDPHSGPNSAPTTAEDSMESPSSGKLVDLPPIPVEGQCEATSDAYAEDPPFNLDRDTYFFGGTPESIQRYKERAAKHMPVKELSPPAEHDEEADELVRFTETRQLLDARMRPYRFGQFSAEMLAMYLGIRSSTKLFAVRPLSMEWDWVIGWYKTTGKFRKPRVSKTAEWIILKDVERIAGEVREPLWWWDDSWTSPGNDRNGDWPETTYLLPAAEP